MTDKAAPSLLEERYGRGRTGRIDKRYAWGIAGTLVLAGIVFVLFGGWQQGTNIEFQELHYEVLNESAVEVDVQVTAPTDETVVCAIEALSAAHGTVGWKIVTVPESDTRMRRFTVTLVTTSPATTGRVRDCWQLTSV